MVKKIKSWLSILFLTAVLSVPGLVFGTDTTLLNNEASPMKRLNNAATGYGPYSQPASETTLASTLGIVINVALSILGVIFLLITIMSGYQWMTAQGNEAQVTKAKDSVTRAIIGLIVVIASYAVWFFIKTYFISKI